MLRAMGFSGPPHSPDSFFKITCALHFCSWMEKRFLQKSRNSGAFGLPASSDDWLDSFFKNFTPCSPHVPKCSRTNGMICLSVCLSVCVSIVQSLCVTVKRKSSSCSLSLNPQLMKKRSARFLHVYCMPLR